MVAVFKNKFEIEASRLKSLGCKTLSAATIRGAFFLNEFPMVYDETELFSRLMISRSKKVSQGSYRQIVIPTGVRNENPVRPDFSMTMLMG